MVVVCTTVALAPAQMDGLSCTVAPQFLLSLSPRFKLPGLKLVPSLACSVRRFPELFSLLGTQKRRGPHRIALRLRCTERGYSTGRSAVDFAFASAFAFVRVASAVLPASLPPCLPRPRRTGGAILHVSLALPRRAPITTFRLLNQPGRGSTQFIGGALQPSPCCAPSHCSPLRFFAEPFPRPFQPRQSIHLICFC
jgi:hypothetical protein